MKPALKLLLPFAAVLFSGCYPCHQEEVGNLKFTKAELQVNPYSGNETLLFSSVSGDTIIFSGGGRGIDDYKVYEIDYEDAKWDHHGCQGDYFYSETSYMCKSDTLNNTRLDIYLHFEYSFKNPTTGKELQIFFADYNKPELYCEGEYYFEADTIFTHPSSDPIIRDSVVTFHDEWTAGNRTFKGVYELSSHGTYPHPDYVNKFFYNLTQGLVGFKTTTGEQWSLCSSN